MAVFTNFKTQLHKHPNKEQLRVGHTHIITELNPLSHALTMQSILLTNNIINVCENRCVFVIRLRKKQQNGLHEIWHGRRYDVPVKRENSINHAGEAAGKS